MSDRDSRYFQTFREVSKRITSTFFLKEVLMLIVERTTKELEAKGCTVRLFDKSKKELVLCASFGLSATYLKKGPVDTDKSITETLKGKPVVVADASKDPRVQYPQEKKTEGIVSILSVPMTVKEKTIGILRVYMPAPHEFDPFEIDFVLALAEQGAIAIENATLYEKVKEEYGNLMDDFEVWFGPRTPTS